MIALLAIDLNVSLQTVVNVLGAGFAAYVGVRVAIAQIQARQDSLQAQIVDVCKRLDRLEHKHFQ